MTSSAESLVRDVLSHAAAPDVAARRAIEERAASVIRPARALARLDELAAWLAEWQRTGRPALKRPSAVVFAADHGMASAGVSAYPQRVTAAMLSALREGVATAAIFAEAVGASLHVVDVGVGRPTDDITERSALEPEAFASCFAAGRSAVASIDTDLLVVGEMGIANTTAAAAVACSLFGGAAEEWTGRGTGIDEETWMRKVSVVEAARRRLEPSLGPIDVLREVGGSELVAMAGAVAEARARSIPVVLDGFVVAAAVAPLEALVPGALDHCVAGHRSAEPGHGLLLEKLAKAPLLDLGLRLGEASGALAAVPLIKLAAAGVVSVATFDEIGLSR